MAASSSIPRSPMVPAEAAKFTPEQVTFKACNFLALTEIPDNRAYYREGATFIKACPLAYAFTCKPSAVTADLQAFWYTAHCTEATLKSGTIVGAIAFEHPTLGKFSFTSSKVRQALKLPTRSRNETWAEEPTADQIVEFLDSIGYRWENPSAKSVGSKCEKKRLCARWQYIFTQVVQSLGTKTGSQDQASKHYQVLLYSLCNNVKLNYAEYIFADLYNKVASVKREKWLPYPRFVAALITATIGDAYQPVNNHSFSVIGKKSLDGDFRSSDPDYTPYMLEVINAAGVFTLSSLQTPPASIPIVTSSSPTPRQPSASQRRPTAQSPPAKRPRVIVAIENPIEALQASPAAAEEERVEIHDILDSPTTTSPTTSPIPPTTTATTAATIAPATTAVPSAEASPALPPLTTALGSSTADAVLGNTLTAFSSSSSLTSLVHTVTNDSEIVVPISDEVTLHAFHQTVVFRYSEQWKTNKTGPQFVSHEQTQHQIGDPFDTFPECEISESNPSDTLMNTTLHPSSNPELFLAHLSVCTGQTAQSTPATTVTTTRAAATTVSDAPKRKTVERPQLILPSTSYPAMEFVVQETAYNKAQMELLRSSVEILYKNVGPKSKSRSALKTLKAEVAESSNRIATIEKTLLSHGKFLASIFGTLEKISEQLKTSNERSTFTAEDRTALHSVQTVQQDQATVTNNLASDVKALLVHSLPLGHPEGERCAAELNNEILDAAINPSHPPTAPSQQKQVTAEEEEEDEEEEEADDDEEDDETPRLRPHNDEDDDDDEEDMMQIRAQPSIPQIIMGGSGTSSQPQGSSDPQGKGKGIAHSAPSEGETNAEVSLPLALYIPPYIITEPSSPHSQNTNNSSSLSPTLSDPCPPLGQPLKAPIDPSSDICPMPIFDLSDDEAEEEGLVPRRRIIRESEEERRTTFIRQIEARRVKIPLRTSELECPVPLSAADEFGFVSPEQRLKAIEEQQKLDKQKQEQIKSEKLARRLYEQELKRKNDESLNDYRSRRLAEQLAKQDLREQNLKTDPFKAQEKLLHSLKTRQKPKDADLEWCQKRLNLRIHEAKITNVSIQGQNSSRGLTIYTTISRGGTIEQKDQAQFLKFYGYTEWLEIREAIQRSKSRFKGDVENIINQLLQRMSRIVEVPSLPERSRKKKKAKVTEAIEDAPPTVNEHDTRFDAQSLFAHLQIPDHSMLNTSLPPSLSDFYENQIIQFPEKGMIFMDNDGYLKFFRNKEIEAAPSQMIRALHYQLWADDLPTQLQKTIFEKEMERRNEEIRAIA